MAKKDTYLALLRRGIDETTAQVLADGGIKIGDLKKLDSETLINNYGIKKEVANSVLDAVKSGPRSSSRQRFLADVLSDDKKKVDKIEETRFKREQKDIHAELQEKKEQLRLARVEDFRNKKLVMNRLGKTIELIVKLENNLDDESKDEQKSKLRDQLETRGLEAARDHEMLELDGTPQDIVDFRRKIARSSACTRARIVGGDGPQGEQYHGEPLRFLIHMLGLRGGISRSHGPVCGI